MQEAVFDPTLSNDKPQGQVGAVVNHAPVVETKPVPATKAVPEGAVAATPVDSIPGVREAPIEGLSLDGIAEETRQIISKQPRLPIFFPLLPGEKAGEAYRSMSINGYRIEVKKNVMVYVPKAFAELAMKSMGAEAEALHGHPNNLANADGEKRRALGLA